MRYVVALVLLAAAAPTATASTCRTTDEPGVSYETQNVDESNQDNAESCRLHFCEFGGAAAAYTYYDKPGWLYNCFLRANLENRMLKPGEATSGVVNDAAPAALARKDVHLWFAHGGRADFRGAHNASFNFLSARNISINARVEFADMKWGGQLVHGSVLKSMYATIRTSASKIITVEYDATSTFATVKDFASGKPIVRVRNQQEEVVDNVRVQMQKKRLSIHTGQWLVEAASVNFPYAALNPEKVLLDISLQPTYSVDDDPIAPHGLIGQSFDRDLLAVDGKVDHLRGPEVTTIAQAEGAIEGTAMDYKMAGKFASAFKYSRFDAVAPVGPRNVAALSGQKHAATKVVAPAKARKARAAAAQEEESPLSSVSSRSL